jgi:hypothetical protein
MGRAPYISNLCSHVHHRIRDAARLHGIRPMTSQFTPYPKHSSFECSERRHEIASVSFIREFFPVDAAVKRAGFPAPPTTGTSPTCLCFPLVARRSCGERPSNWNSPAKAASSVSKSCRSRVRADHSIMTRGGGPAACNEAPVDAGDLPSRLYRLLRCVVSPPPCVWSSRPRVSTA